MLRVSLIAVFSLLFQLSHASGFVSGEYDLPNDIKITELGDGVFVATDKAFFSSNTLIVKMKDGTVVFSSSPFENLGTGSLLKWVRANLSPTKIVAINTHYHRDGTGGNYVFRNNGVETWASDLTNQLLRNELKSSDDSHLDFFDNDEQRKRIKNSQQTLAENTFTIADGKVFDFSGEKVIVSFPGHAHSPDNLVVYFPSRKILFGGCMIKSKSIGYTAVADVKNWVGAAKKLKNYDVQTVIPGHGKWGGKNLIDKTIKVVTNHNKDTN